MHLFKNFKKFSENTALYNPDFGKVAYKDLIKKSYEIASSVKQRSLILIISKNSVEDIMIYTAAISNNHVIMFIDAKTNHKHLLDIINIYKPDYIFAPKSMQNELNLSEYENNLPFKNHFFSKRKILINCSMNSELSVLLPTSGSMGSSKFVRLSKRNISSNTMSIVKYLNISQSEKAITNMPLSYSYMFSVINSHLISGASLLVTNRSLLEKKFWTEAREFRITSFSGVPFMYEMLEKLGLENTWIPSIKYFTQAGGKLDYDKTLKIINFCKTKKAKFLVMYGQTEASPRMSYLKWEDATSKIGSIGSAIPNTKMWIENENSEKIEKAGLEGELVFSGQNVSLGYAEKRIDLEKGDVNEGILYTGDLAMTDEEGFFYLKGRIKRIAKIFGNRINLDEIQNRMKDLGIEVACIEKNNKILVYYENNLYVDFIDKKIIEVTGQNKNVFKTCKIDKIPRTSSLKINYAQLTEDFIHA